MTRAGSAKRTEKARTSYHHGDLRAALVEKAGEILHAEGLDALTLRAVARAAGVSQTAPYRHFADRRALMGAVAAEGFRKLSLAMGKAMAKDGGRSGFRGVAIAYVRFAKTHPALYRVMFGPEVANTDDLPELASSARASLGFVQNGIERLQDAGLIRKGDASLMAVASWAALHGLALLILDGQASTVTPSVDALIDSTTEMMMFGMAPR